MFFSFWGLLDGVVRASWELFWAMVVRSWVVLACFGAKLRYVGGKMATKSARMSQHRRQGPNPRGFEGFTDSPDGR